MRCYFTKYKEYFKFSERCLWSKWYQTMRTVSVSIIQSQKNEIFSRTNGQKIFEIQSWRLFLVYREDVRVTCGISLDKQSLSSSENIRFISWEILPPTL